MQIILASNNQNKVDELKSILNIEILSLTDIGFTQEIEEFGHTFEQNALIKAQAIAKLYPDSIIISDDSGLEVDYLNGAPGVYSKRFANASYDVDRKNNELLLHKMQGVNERFAQFRTVLCVYNAKSEICNFYNGIVRGEIATKLSGDNGFGYDPLFVYQGTSFGKLTKEQKNQVSHRARAITKMLESGVLNV